MRRVCNYNLTHKKDLLMGVKAPLDDDSTSHGVCIGCLVIWYYKNGFTKTEIRETMKSLREGR